MQGTVNRRTFLRNLPGPREARWPACLPGRTGSPSLFQLCLSSLSPPSRAAPLPQRQAPWTLPAPSGACPEFFHDPVTRITACPPLSQQHCILEMVLPMCDGGWAQGIGLVEFLAECCRPPLTVIHHPQSFPCHWMLGEPRLQAKCFIRQLLVAWLGTKISRPQKTEAHSRGSCVQDRTFPVASSAWAQGSARLS